MPTPDTLSARADALAQLRAAMRRHHIDAVVVPSADPHLSEYLPGRWKGREWLSGFTGSVGTFIATHDFAGVWTDARYWAPAEAELAGSGVRLMKIPSGASLMHIDWLAANMACGQSVAVDARVLGLSTARLLADALGARDIKLRTDLDLLDEVWTEPPGLPDAPVFEHVPPYASMDRAAKLRCHPRRNACGGRHPPLHLDPRRHRLAVQPARGGRQLQPGIPGPCADRAAGRDPVRRRRQSRPELRLRLMADGVEVAPYAEAARRWPVWRRARCCWSTRAASQPACAQRWPAASR